MQDMMNGHYCYFALGHAINNEKTVPGKQIYIDILYG